MTDAASLLAVLRISSPALPVGAFAYSQGFEYAVDAGWVKNAADTESWASGVLTHGLSYLDVPLLVRLYRSVGQPEDFKYWNQHCIASRETEELRQEERQLGKTLYQLLLKLEQPLPATLQQEGEIPGWLAMFAFACYRWEMSEEQACLAYVWSWLENQLAAAAKTVPIGQTDVQKITARLMPFLMQVVEKGKSRRDDDIFGGLPGLSMASALHEKQYSRLFRS
ncbi:urease accessory protein UreF [Porticoccus sp. W117]|uniref:urease accessory protein UreF n=1 Tax=Porticoccus sp. W117 TaxID=3054777 RepID=UPI0025928998|nr:urease accessory protein UreF [Porticoccus sp. W117]MDM3872341.1 urease accessory protein UreF [Porticoccus sp. W117]